MSAGAESLKSSDTGLFSASELTGDFGEDGAESVRAGGRGGSASRGPAMERADLA